MRRTIVANFRIQIPGNDTYSGDGLKLINVRSRHATQVMKPHFHTIVGPEENIYSCKYSIFVRDITQKET